MNDPTRTAEQGGTTDPAYVAALERVAAEASKLDEEWEYPDEWWALHRALRRAALAARGGAA